MLIAVESAGVITGFACASTKDQSLAETFFALGARPDCRLPSAGSAASGPYVVDKGFEGEDNHRRWLDCYGARVICLPKRHARKRRSWPKVLRRWAASIRQIVESVYEILHATFGLRAERPHELQGMRARLAARVALHNYCIWLNDQLERPTWPLPTCWGGDLNSHQAFNYPLASRLEPVPTGE